MNAPHTTAWQLRKALWHYSRPLHLNTQTALDPQQQNRTLIIASEPIIRPAATAQEISTVNKLAHYNKNRTSYNQHMTSNKRYYYPTKPRLYLFKSYNQSFPQTQKTHELNFQRQLFISNEWHWAPLTNWHLSEKCVTLTTARLVRLSKWV